MDSIVPQILDQQPPRDYSKTILGRMPPEIRNMVFNYVFDNELTIWVTRGTPTKPPDEPERLCAPKPCISKNPGTHPLMNVCRALRKDLIAGPAYVTAKTNVYAFAADLSLLSQYRTPPVKKIHLQMYKATVDVSEYRRRLWQQDAGWLARTMPKLETVRIGVLSPPPKHTTSIDDALTIAELDAICQEVVDAHPGLSSFTHVVNSNGVISYTISK